MPAELVDITADMFRAHVGETFVFARPSGQQAVSEGKARLKLVEVSEPRGAKEQAVLHCRRPPFSLLFVLEEAVPPLRGGLHRLLHDDFSPDEWLVERVSVSSPDPGRAYYEAVFS